jgi:hypothetical protein
VSDEIDPATAYMVWQVDCPCGSVISYNADESSLPDECEECGRPVGIDDNP